MMMKIISTLSIRTKIVAGSSAIMVLAMLFVATYYPSKQEQQIYEAFQSRVAGMADMLALSTGIAFGLEEYSAIIETFEWAKSDSLVSYIILTDEYEIIFAEYNPDSISVKDILNTDHDPFWVKSGFLKMSAPVVYNNIERGTLYLGYSLQRVQKQLSYNSRIALIITFSIFGLGLILAFVNGHLITKRLKGLQAAAQNVSMGNFNINFQNYGSDELGVLAEAFKTMLNSVQTNIQLVQKSEKRVLDITATLGEAVCVIDEKGKITFSNLEASKLLGWTHEELIGIDLHASLHNHKTEHAEIMDSECPLNLKNMSGQHQHQHDHSFMNKAGSPLAVSYNMNQISHDGRSSGWVLTFHNIAERKQRIKVLSDTKEEFRILSEQLTESDSIKELLLDIITHDLKNPAGNILSISEMMASEDPENEMLDLIHKSSSRLLTVMDDAVTLYQASFGEDIVKDHILLAPLISQIVEDMNSVIMRNEMEVESLISDEVSIFANPLIAEVFKNYISNAIKYAKEGKKILIECKLESNSILVTCKDFGTTIPEKYRKKVFTRRAQLAKGKKKRGRGLGLAIVSRIAESHQGSVWVEANSPTGNSFCLRIPRDGIDTPL